MILVNPAIQINGGMPGGLPCIIKIYYFDESLIIKVVGNTICSNGI